jgi:galactofuranosylgalactofuranosylrhamnosyl-N-acetylglucosaminyl-diphospho-decaprenol beta-1,5/1,6-galactofuranosyltransferase
MQYFTEHGRIEALKDLFKGPGELHGVLGTKLPEINALKASYPVAQL